MSASKPNTKPMVSAGHSGAALTILLLGLALAACDSGGGTGPGGVSEGEAQALEEAAEMLDQRRLPDGALPTVATPPANPDTIAEDTAEVTGDSDE